MKSIAAIITTSVLLVLVPGCGDEEKVISVLVGKTFNHTFFDSQQECNDAQPNPNFFINCHQQLHFIDTQHAEIMLTDIINNVQYTCTKNRIVISPSSRSEFSSDITFEIMDGCTLIRIGNQTLWKEQTGSSIWD